MGALISRFCGCCLMRDTIDDRYREMPSNTMWQRDACSMQLRNLAFVTNENSAVEAKDEHDSKSSKSPEETRKDEPYKQLTHPYWREKNSKKPPPPPSDEEDEDDENTVQQVKDGKTYMVTFIDTLQITIYRYLPLYVFEI